MDAVFVNFEKDIIELRQHINYIKSISLQVPHGSDVQIYINSLPNRQFNYKSLVISLYGIVESYAEKFITKYLEELSILIKEYSNLKKTIQNKNVYNTANLALKVIEQKLIKYNHLKEEDLISNLHSCIINSPTYLINYDAFTMLTGNMTHLRMSDLFKQVGIDLNEKFANYTDFNLSSENQFKKLDELVEMRNEVAHGSVSSFLDPSQIEEYVDFIERYFKNLLIVLKVDIKQEKLKYWKNNYAVKINNTSVFNGNIVGFENAQNLIVSTASLIIIEKLDKSCQVANVLNIHEFDNGSITLKLEPETNLKSTHQFYLKLENA